MSNNLYEIIEELNSTSLYYYIFVITFSIILFNSKKIELNNIMGLFFGFMIVVYLYQKEKNNINLQNKQNEIKIDKLNEKININKLTKYDKIIDFIFSIKEFYYFNRQEFNLFILNLEKFFDVYENTKIDNIFYSQYYKILENLAYKSYNSLHSIIFNLGGYPKLIDKLNRSCKILHELLDNYLDEIFDLTKKKKIINGLNSNTIAIYDGPKEYNLFNNKKFTYNFF